MLPNAFPLSPLLMLLAKASGGVRIDIGNIAWPELSVDGRNPATYAMAHKIVRGFADRTTRRFCHIRGLH